MASQSSQSSKSRKRQAQSAAAVLDEIESLGDRVTRWVGQNPLPVLGTALAVLVAAAAWGLIGSHFEETLVEASGALAEVQAEYRVAMGGDPRSPAEAREAPDAETARRVRSEFIERYEQVARDYAGTAAAALARLEAGGLQQELGQLEEALDTWRDTAAELAPDDPIRALVLVRIAAAEEAEGRWLEAAETYETAAGVERYPLRYRALADAARCFDRGGEPDRALAAVAQIPEGAPQQQVPEYVNARMAELRARENLE